MHCIKKDILTTLTYFDMFDYPLKKNEIIIFLSRTIVLPEFDKALDQLINASLIYKLEEFYAMKNDAVLAERRYKGNEKARQLILKAEKAAAFLSRFPYVRGVAVSGSLSKNFADDSADIDFFIITAANRLWIARTCMHLFKKLTFLVNRQHYFCMNYFVDEQEPVIVEKNIYTATEIGTLITMRGEECFDNFYTANNWTKDFLPNNSMRISSAKENKSSWIQFIIEKVLNNRIGNVLDKTLMKWTAKSWDTKTRNKKRNSRGIVMSLLANRHFAKPDPENYQKKLLQLFEEKVSNILEQYERSFHLSDEII